MPTPIPPFPDPSLAQSYGSPLELVGNTPLVKLNTLAKGLPGEVHVKLDQFNLGGSSKDRIAFNIVREATLAGELKPGDRIIDNGAGNTALGFALAGAATGHPVTVVANSTLAPGKEQLLRLLGAEILRGRPDLPFSDPGNWEAIAARHADEDQSTWWSHQSATPWNPEAHQATTGPEIWHQSAGRVTHFLAAIATGGTVSGTGSYLKQQNPDVQVIATDFAEGPNSESDLVDVIAGTSPFVEEHWPHNINTGVIDRLELRHRADAIDLGWKLARTEGLVLGITSALSILVALDLAAEVDDGAVIVAFSADHGRDYLQHEYDAQWLRENGFGHIADRYAPLDRCAKD